MPSPIGHLLMGCSLYTDRTHVRRRSWWTLALFIFFANAPDLDFIPGLLVGQPALFHRSVTHSLLFPVVVSAAVFLVFWWRGRAEAGRLARVAFFGLLSHIALDYFCAASPDSGLMLLWPLTERFAAPKALFPLLSTHHVMSWGNVVTVMGEATIMSVFLLVAGVRRALSERVVTVERRRVAPAGEPAYSMAEAGE